MASAASVPPTPIIPVDAGDVTSAPPGTVGGRSRCELGCTVTADTVPGLNGDFSVDYNRLWL